MLNLRPAALRAFVDCSLTVVPQAAVLPIRPCLPVSEASAMQPIEQPAACERAPIGLLAELTHRCPLQCPYCSNPLALERAAGELETAAWQDVLRHAARLGVLQGALAGGLDPRVDRAEGVVEPLGRAAHDGRRRTFDGRELERRETVVVDGHLARDPQRGRESQGSILVIRVLVEGERQPVRV